MAKSARDAKKVRGNGFLVRGFFSDFETFFKESLLYLIFFLIFVVGIHCVQACAFYNLDLLGQ